jgi:hypothetical protein
VRALVLRQPSLLARTTEGLAGKVDAYAEMFGRDSVGKVGWGSIAYWLQDRWLLDGPLS